MANGEIVAKYKTALHLKLIDAAVAVTDGVWMDAGLYEVASIEFSGITTATLHLNGSNAAVKPVNTVHGFQIGPNITADGDLSIPGSDVVAGDNFHGVLPRWIKARISVWTAGTISVLALLRTAR